MAQLLVDRLVLGQRDVHAITSSTPKAIAALSHPHICTLHDVGRHGDTEYLVMEFLDGETLAARLQRPRGSLPIEQVLTFGAQIADALDKAHRAGIVHRDLQPANIMLTKAGTKLLDFGLAKLHGPAVPLGMSAIEGTKAASPDISSDDKWPARRSNRLDPCRKSTDLASGFGRCRNTARSPLLPGAAPRRPLDAIPALR